MASSDDDENFDESYDSDIGETKTLFTEEDSPPSSFVDPSPFLFLIETPRDTPRKPQTPTLPPSLSPESSSHTSPPIELPSPFSLRESLSLHRKRTNLEASLLPSSPPSPCTFFPVLPSPSEPSSPCLPSSLPSLPNSDLVLKELSASSSFSHISAHSPPSSSLPLSDSVLALEHSNSLESTLTSPSSSPLPTPVLILEPSSSLTRIPALPSPATSPRLSIVTQMQSVEPNPVPPIITNNNIDENYNNDSNNSNSEKEEVPAICPICWVGSISSSSLICSCQNLRACTDCWRSMLQVHLDVGTDWGCHICKSGPSTEELERELPGEPLIERLRTQRRLERQKTHPSLVDCGYCHQELEKTGVPLQPVYCGSCRLFLCQACGFRDCTRMTQVPARECLNSGEGEEEAPQKPKKTVRRVWHSIKATGCKWINTKTCPNCGVRIQKNGGCHHMGCSRCFTTFCWHCKRTTGQGHYPWCTYQLGGAGLWVLVVVGIVVASPVLIPYWIYDCARE